MNVHTPVLAVVDSVLEAVRASITAAAVAQSSPSCDRVTKKERRSSAR
jgi:hypothetical protein